MPPLTAVAKREVLRKELSGLSPDELRFLVTRQLRWLRAWGCLGPGKVAPALGWAVVLLLCCCCLVGCRGHTWRGDVGLGRP